MVQCLTNAQLFISTFILSFCVSALCYMESDLSLSKAGAFVTAKLYTLLNISGIFICLTLGIST